MLVACECGYLGVAKWLFEMSATKYIRTKNSAGRSPMLLAYECGRLQPLNRLRP
jgi:hypothetical protein